MSLAESFFSTAKDLLMTNENLKRMDAQLNQLSTDMHNLDRRLMKVELMIDLAQQTSRKRSPRELP